MHEGQWTLINEIPIKLVENKHRRYTIGSRFAPIIMALSSLVAYGSLGGRLSADNRKKDEAIMRTITIAFCRHHAFEKCMAFIRLVGFVSHLRSTVIHVTVSFSKYVHYLFFGLLRHWGFIIRRKRIVPGKRIANHSYLLDHGNIHYDQNDALYK